MTVRPLFRDADLAATLDVNLARAKRAVDEVPEGQFRDADSTLLANEIFSRFAIEPVSLTEGAISVEAHDTDIDRRKIPDRHWGFDDDPPTVRGTRVIYNVPFTGDGAIFLLKPSTWTTVLPRAVLADSELRFVYEVQSSAVAGTKASLERELALTKQWLGWANDQVSKYNVDVAAAIEAAVNQRNSRLDAASQGLAALGLPVRQSRSVRIDAHLVRPPAQASQGESAPTGPQYDVALSFAGEDRPYVEKVANYLAETGVRVFYDEFQKVSLWGKDLVAHLQDIYQNAARFCVLFISQHYVSKPWPTHERRSAQARALVAKEEYLLPARFDDSAIPGLPPTIGFVDLRGMEPAAFADLVLRKVQGSADA